MKVFARIACVLLLVGCALAQGKGIKPRSRPSDFPASATVNGLTIAAARLSTKQLEHAFATNLHEGYIVLEVAVYPTNDKVVLDPANFFLHVDGTKTVLRPTAPETIATVLQKPTGRDVTLYPTANVGYATGPDIYGGQSGVTKGVGLGVGISRKEQKSEADRKVMEAELSDKALPSGTFAKPVSGHLYFPISTKRNVQYVLRYDDDRVKLNIALPAQPE